MPLVSGRIAIRIPGGNRKRLQPTFVAKTAPRRELRPSTVCHTRLSLNRNTAAGDWSSSNKKHAFRAFSMRFEIEKRCISRKFLKTSFTLSDSTLAEFFSGQRCRGTFFPFCNFLRLFAVGLRMVNVTRKHGKRHLPATMAIAPRTMYGRLLLMCASMKINCDAIPPSRAHALHMPTPFPLHNKISPSPGM